MCELCNRYWAEVSSGQLGFIVVLLHFNVELALVRLMID